jgi:hypothetical protein
MQQDFNDCESLVKAQAIRPGLERIVKEATLLL